ncbi:hypothetical protein ACN28S_30025 [Cystobacter fuscus]
MDKIKLRIGERFKSRKLALSCFVMLLGAAGFLLVGKFRGSPWSTPSSACSCSGPAPSTWAGIQPPSSSRPALR